MFHKTRILLIFFSLCFSSFAGPFPRHAYYICERTKLRKKLQKTKFSSTENCYNFVLFSNQRNEHPSKGADYTYTPRLPSEQRGVITNDALHQSYHQQPKQKRNSDSTLSYTPPMTRDKESITFSTYFLIV